MYRERVKVTTLAIEACVVCQLSVSNKCTGRTNIVEGGQASTGEYVAPRLAASMGQSDVTRGEQANASNDGDDGDGVVSAVVAPAHPGPEDGCTQDIAEAEAGGQVQRVLEADSVFWGFCHLATILHGRDHRRQKGRRSSVL